MDDDQDPQPVRPNAEEKISEERRRAANLPHDVIYSILTRLPVRSLLRFRCVCQQWRATIAEPRFVSDHLEASRAAHPGSISVDKQEQKLFCTDSDGVVTVEAMLSPELGKLGSGIMHLQSCNGLLFVGTCTHLLICNIAICRVSVLPEFGIKVPPVPWSLHFPGYGHVYDQSLCSLGVDPSTQQYKVLHMADVGKYNQCWECEILTLGGDQPPSWRKIGRCPVPVVAFRHTFLDGVLYWITGPDPPDNMTSHILSFDLRSEKFGVLPLPKRLTLGDIDFMSVIVLGGHLGVAEVHSCLPQGRKVLHLWMLLEPSKGKRGWYSEYITPPFDFEDDIYPVAIHRGKILIHEPLVRSYYYRLRDGAVDLLREDTDAFRLGPFVDHVESLVWPWPLN